MPDQFVANYQEKFEHFYIRGLVHSLSRKKMNFISVCLADYIAIEVEAHNSPNLTTMMSLSQLYESKE